MPHYPLKISTFIVSLYAAGVCAAPAHVHGAAQMDVVLDGNTLLIRAEIPLHDLLGFERAPRSPGEQQAVRDIAARLRNAGAWATSADAQCRLQHSDLSSPVLRAEDLGAKSASPARTPTTTEHAELSVEWRWQCTQPHALRALHAHWLAKTPALLRVDVRWINAGKQGAKRLSSKDVVLQW